MSIFFSNPKGGFKSIKKKILNNLEDLIDSGEYILGSNVNLFEKEMVSYLGSKGYFVSCANGTDAITLALLSNDIDSGKVIVPSHTATASVVGIQKAGCSPIFVDIDSKTLLMSICEVERALKKYKNIKAILAVHLYGTGININKLKKVAKKYKCIVIEDCAQSHGTKIYGEQAGTIASGGTFSFFPTKNLAALGDGGGIWVPSKKIRDKAISLRQYGWNQKRIVTNSNGFNSRLDEIQAMILRIRLKNLNQDIKKRQKIAEIYQTKLCDSFEQIAYPDYQSSSFHLFVVKVKNRSKLMSYLAKNDIYLGIHYFPSNHNNGKLKTKRSSLPITDHASKSVVSLPIFPELKKVDQLRIIELLNSFYGN
jgi:dTDP-4-amino-4,6-dideoxygalactose transaminase